MKNETYYSDYDNEPIGGSNPYYRCVHCKVSDPEINGRLEGHREWCKYRIKKEKELGLTYLFNELTSYIENWEDDIEFLIKEERYIEFKKKIQELINTK